MGVLLGALVPHPPIMIPQVGGKDARQVRATRRAMKSLARRVRQQAPDTVVVITPHAPASQRCLYYGQERLHGDLSAFGAPDVAVAWPCDHALLGSLDSLLAEEKLTVVEGPARSLDHGALVPLYFLAQAGVRCRLVVLSAPLWSGRNLHLLGQCLSRAADDTGSSLVVLASGDLSHRLKPSAPAGYHPRGAEFDREVMEILSRGDFPALYALDPVLVEAAGQCALHPLLILGGVWGDEKVRGWRLAYEAPFGVGYGVVSFAPPHPLVALARQALRSYLQDGTRIDAPELPASLPDRAGVFVSLKARGQLRGCIGTMEPTRIGLGDEVIENAIAAATHDDRFARLSLEELPEVDISVDVLGPREPIEGLEQLDPRRYGVVVAKGNRVGLLLPALEGIEDARQQVAIACQKAGLRPDDPQLTLYRFEVTRYE